MFKQSKKVLVAVSVLSAFAFSFFVDVNQSTDNTVKLSVGSAVEAAPRWLEDFGDDIRDDYRREARRTGREIRRENRRAAKEAREEQRNIARADGDSRFKDEYLTDDELTALRTLKSLPVGKKIFIECFKDQASDIKRMCNKLPEFSFVKYNKDEYKEYIGCTVIRRSYR